MKICIIIRIMKTDTCFYVISWIIMIGLVVIGILHHTGLFTPTDDLAFPCFFRSATGLYCPGCGGTRAVVALMHAHPLQSAWYHPLVPYTAVLFGLFMGSHLLEHLHIGKIRGLRFRNWYLWAAVGITAANWILKNVLLIFFHVTL